MMAGHIYQNSVHRHLSAIRILCPRKHMQNHKILAKFKSLWTKMGRYVYTQGPHGKPNQVI